MNWKIWDRKWKPGDFAVIKNVALPENWPKDWQSLPDGTIVELISYEGDIEQQNVTVLATWYVGIIAGQDWVVSEACLQPLPPEDTATDWSECVWKPKELVRVAEDEIIA